MNLEDDKAVPNPDPEEEELLIEWANERPTVERLLTGPPVVVEGSPDDEIVEIVVDPDPGAFMGDFDIGEFLWMDKPADWMDK